MLSPSEQDAGDRPPSGSDSHPSGSPGGDLARSDGLAGTLDEHPELRRHAEDAVSNAMRGIRRRQQHRPDEAQSLMTYHLKRMVDALPKIAEKYRARKRERTKTAAGAELTAGEQRFLRLLRLRNRALLLLGYAGALRRSEIARLRSEIFAESRLRAS